ncbi:MAG: GntR family transcriptional regulator [Hyphomicrobiales bacterium]|nr:GntR family transcriptional regulator [Hyphomicrobiales bacterium]
MAMSKRAQKAASMARESAPPRRNRINFNELAYEKIEDLLVRCVLRPGRFLTVQDLQDATGLGRTPVHNAVAQFAADTLIQIRPRHGLQIAPIDLARERMLLELRRDIERFVVRLATKRATLSHRHQARNIARALKDNRDRLTLEEFNKLDLRIDSLMLEASGEPFLSHTLRPLHTIFRRIGFIYHRHTPGHADLAGTVDGHIAILAALTDGDATRAEAASDRLMNFMESMFDDMAANIDPGLLDCGIEPLPIS